MSDTNPETTNQQQSSPRGISIHTETIAKGALRIKTKIWIDELDLSEGIVAAATLYDETLAEYRKRGYKIDGDV